MKRGTLWLHKGFTKMTMTIQKACPQSFANWVLVISPTGLSLHNAMGHTRNTIESRSSTLKRSFHESN